MKPPTGAWATGDIAQITDEGHAWHPCLVIVTEPKPPWGVMGCVLIPQTNDGSEKPGLAYIRLKHEQIEWVGRTHYVPQ